MVLLIMAIFTTMAIFPSAAYTQIHCHKAKSFPTLQASSLMLTISPGDGQCSQAPTLVGGNQPLEEGFENTVRTVWVYLSIRPISKLCRLIWREKLIMKYH